MKIGVLALQGAVSEHIKQIESAGQAAVAVKKASELSSLDALIIPGGESTAIRKLIDYYEFKAPIQQFSAEKKPIFGTCAGLVLLANELADGSEAHLRLMDISVKRNAFGRQKDSFETMLQVKGFTDNVPAVFIRAPIITEVTEHVEVLATYDNQIVAAKQGHLLVTSFHPELTEDNRWMKLFIEMVKQAQQMSTIH
ncbi:pyridoxal 5'-phosphate synthase glutaminase subunit PdxT [Cytobacillus sp. FSL R5-0569]|uniref:pyridoxal 5'-phosphate synthase glutaminase subunit PdxT n=1 Tax=Cytobacillus sp. FSL R5-0569 TaxID=2921649 RepID=UPI0030FB4BE3